MNHDLKMRYSQLKENDPTTKEIPAEQNVRSYNEFYQEESHARNVSFVWPNGRRMFMNYTCLVGVDCRPDASSIILVFTTHVFTLTGVNLKDLYYDLMRWLPLQIICQDSRYNLIGENEQFAVNQIELKNNTQSV